ncbi:MAG TPA: hypothetical protein VG755_01935 [Nannocystaceae bacterium]|nr:hypothetical protein [Nannocystaceae bacterium]
MAPAARFRPPVVLAILLAAGTAQAADVPADPSNYQELLGTLQPGDTLVLAPGEYPRITIDGLNGTADAWITIAGQTDGSAIVTSDSCCNTVQIYGSSYVAIRDLVVDVQGLEVDAINAKDTPSHHILVERNTLQGFPAGSQQIVGINTKTTVHGWTIRGNTIIEPGTGLYLGGSEGDTPFVDGVIEQNLVVNPVGYCMQIKHQLDYTAPPELDAGPHVTIVRNNVFIKDDRESPDGDRPNLLVGGFPDAGQGAEDTYQIYGNLLFYNPREALLQATGRVSIHDNVMVGASPDFAAITVTDHQGKTVKRAYVYNNTIFGGGIAFSSAASEDDAVFGNLVFGDDPIRGTIADLRDNLTATQADADMYVNDPAVMLGAMDFYPLVGAVAGAALDVAKVTNDPDYDRDYNGTAKGDFTFRGAYAGEGMNPGCPLDAELKDGCGAGESGGDDDSGGVDESGSEGGSGNASASGSSTGSASGNDTSGADGSTSATSGGASESGGGDGCGCDQSQPRGAAFFVLALLWRRRVSAADRRCRAA